MPGFGTQSNNGECSLRPLIDLNSWIKGLRLPSPLLLSLSEHDNAQVPGFGTQSNNGEASLRPLMGLIQQDGAYNELNRVGSLMNLI